METNLIFALAVGLILGAIITYILKTKSKNNIDVVNNNIDYSIVDNLKNTIKDLENEKSNLVDNLTEFEKLKFERQELSNKLIEYEKLLNSVQTSVIDNNFSDDITIKLQNEIKNLESKIEDLEDDLEDNEKKLNKLKAQITEIEEQFSIKEKENKILKEEQETLRSEVKELTHKNEENANSLTFINNILNASNAYNEDFEKLDHESWEIFSFIEKVITKYFESTDDIEGQAWQWRNSEIKTWIKGKKVISIVGEFSAGKTSIVNKILSQDNPNVQLLPVSSKETTAIPTYISNGKDFNCQFFSPDNELRNVSKQTFEMVTKSVLDKVNVSHLIKYFVLSYENKNLENISILDTPGFGSNSEEVIKRTTDVIKESDAVFWIIDANTGDINQTSLDVMKNHLKEMPLYFILNKCDTKSINDLNLLEEKIRETATKNDIRFNGIIRFSQKDNVDILLNILTEIKQKNQFNLLRAIDSKLNELIIVEKSEQKEIRELLSRNFTDLDITQNNFKIIQDDIIYSADKIKRLVKEKETWGGFGKNKYEIERVDYDDFQDNVDVIVDLSSAIKEHVEFHSERIKEKIKIESVLNDYKYSIENIGLDRKRFRELVNNYNPNLLK